MIWAMDHPPTDPHRPTHDDTTPHPSDPARGPAPDPGSPTARRLAIVCAIVFASLAILWQNLPQDAQYRLIGAAPPQLPDDLPAIGAVSQVNILGRVYVRLNHLYEGMGMPLGPQAMPFIDDAAMTTGDKIAAAIIAAELFDDPQHAIDRLQDIRADLQNRIAELPETTDALVAEETNDAQTESKTNAELLLDTKHLLWIYEGRHDLLTPDSRERLERRYPYFGRLATTSNLDDADPARAQLLSGGMLIITVLLLLALLIFVVFVTGLVLLVVGAVGLSSRRLKMTFAPPAPGGSVFIEVYALFVAGFLVMTVGTTAVSLVNEPVAALVSLLVQWTLLLVPFWPLLRGMNGRDYRLAIGLHRGRGVVREVWAGALAYIASVPVFFFGVALTFLLLILAEAIRAALGKAPAPPPENPVVDIVSQGDPLVLGLIFILATVWAPITEELVFRGALYRALRARLVWPAAAIVVGLLFAFMHAYGPLMVSPLVALGFMFSFMREWRGSIIACMTAHFIHNFSVFCIAGTVIWMLA